ncbi:hypothetical protein AeMF1_016798 [Aphanomyces euteiches]|nr:hypothetical protein AeMF1_016798 [Aphanomyces euteiches]KAH9196789.1 hypothetical protein AeNC1_001220 [Aphanomyces euteiches]
MHPSKVRLSAPPTLETSASRILYINDRHATAQTAFGHLHAGNEVRTSKYSLLTFLPKTLFEQFRRIANFYFLVVSVLQLSTPYSPTNKYSTVGPLIFVLLATMIKEAVEDKARHSADRIVNLSKSTKFDAESRTWQNFLWKDLCVGDVVRVCENESFPADLVILKSSSSDGQAFVQTTNLDGETDLKIRYSPDMKNLELDAEIFPSKFVGEIMYEPPNRQIYKFVGVLKLTEVNDSQIFEIPLTINNVALRGMTLANTSFIVGVIVGAGADTKLMLNSKRTPSKFSRLDVIANRCIMLIFGVLLTVCCISTILNFVSTQRDGDVLAKMVTYNFGSNEKSFISTFLGYLILYNNLVPISLYISLEIVKWYQAKNIEADSNLVRSSDIQE